MLGSAALAGSSLSAQNLITNGDFETGISGNGYSAVNYNSEAGTFLPTANTYNTSNWQLFGATFLPAEFRYLGDASVTRPDPNSSWATRMGAYTDSYLRNTSSIFLEAGNEYTFSADHWGQLDDNSGLANTTSFFISLYNPLTQDIFVFDQNNVSQLLTGTFILETNNPGGFFTDSTNGVTQHLRNLTISETGNYQLQLSGSGDNGFLDRAWVDNISLTPVPEPSSIAMVLGLGALGFTFYRRRQARDST